MGSIRITVAELATNIRIWLTIVGQRRPGLIRDLWTRRGEHYDGEKIAFARRELANELAERLLRTSWEVSRPETPQDVLLREAEAEAGRGRDEP